MNTDFTGAVRGLIKQELNAIHTSLPATVIRVKGNDLDVQPLVNLYRSGTHRKLPIVYSVPFMSPRTKKAGIQWEVEIGDKVLLMVVEMSIDNAMVTKGNNVVNSEDGRAFNLSDAIAINGFFSETENKPLPKDVGLQVKYDKQTITIKKNGDIEVGGKNLKKLITEDFKSIYNNHVHGYIPTGSTTAIPTTSPMKSVAESTLPSVITALELTKKTKVE